MNSDVVFFTLPPYSCKSPNPAFSILKSSLEKDGVSVLVKYPNIQLYNKTNLTDTSSNEYDELIPYLHLLNSLYKNTTKQEEIKLRYFSLFGERYLTDKSLTDEFWHESLNYINEIFDNTIESLDISSVKFFGFSEKFYQWVPAILFAQKLKSKYPQIPIIIGGFGDRDKAVIFLNSFKYFDFATWGEGEDVLHKFYKELVFNDKKNLKDVPRLVYREFDKILFSNTKSSYLQLNKDVLPDFSDFFAINNPHEREQIRIPIEASRGCHWCKCKFCYLNQGYKYRGSCREDLLQSIETLITKYDCYNISFVDNDIIGLSIDKFEKLLDGLIQLRQKTNNRLRIKVAEVVPFRKDSSIVKKMALAGFENIQIGYEAVTDSLLKNMNKKQDLSMNIFLIKFCKKYGIQISGANVIADTITESSKDIVDSIHNLHYFRFLFSDNYYKHQVINLCLTRKASFYKDVPKEELVKWNINWLYNNLPEFLNSEEERFIFFDFQKETGNELWKCFDNASKHYYNNQFSYKLFLNEQRVEYREYCNTEEIKSLTFDDGYYWEILKLANNKVLGIDEICSELQLLYKKNVKSELVMQQIAEMRDEYILYANQNYSSVISIIDTQKIFT